MRSDPAIARFDIAPDYGRGFVFHWRVGGGFEDRGPWKFRVQRGMSPEGDWSDVSPELDGVFSYRSEGPLRVNKSRTLCFRLVMSTPDGEYRTGAVAPYGDLSRSEFLLGSEVMRREVLHMANMAGVECGIWSRVEYGPKCIRCTDPVTGHSRDNHCPLCLGTGRFPPYSGPFRVWCLFTEDAQHSVDEGAEGNGVTEGRKFDVRTVCSVPVGKNDVLRDERTGKAYHVNAVKVSAELRRVPLVQTLSVSEAAVTDPAYSVMGVGHGA